MIRRVGRRFIVGRLIRLIRRLITARRRIRRLVVGRLILHRLIGRTDLLEADVDRLIVGQLCPAQFGDVFDLFAVDGDRGDLVALIRRDGQLVALTHRHFGSTDRRDRAVAAGHAGHHQIGVRRGKTEQVGAVFLVGKDDGIGIHRHELVLVDVVYRTVFGQLQRMLALRGGMRLQISTVLDDVHRQIIRVGVDTLHRHQVADHGRRKRHTRRVDAGPLAHILGDQRRLAVILQHTEDLVAAVELGGVAIDDRRLIVSRERGLDAVYLTGQTVGEVTELVGLVAFIGDDHLLRTVTLLQHHRDAGQRGHHVDIVDVAVGNAVGVHPHHDLAVLLEIPVDGRFLFGGQLVGGEDDVDLMILYLIVHQ